MVCVDSQVILQRVVECVYAPKIREACKTTSQLLTTHDSPEKYHGGPGSDGKAHLEMTGRFVADNEHQSEGTSFLLKAVR